ncbi:MAG: flagellar filament capping protein FliD [Selenomonadaceae bacterium]|nr:flagellar filament capping protein FliD [Selenomonadaceae bacterium]
MGVNGIYGLSGSGIDVESMVKVGMMSKQNEYDKMAQKYTKNEWTKTELIEINNTITTFNLSTLSDYKMSASMNARTAESSNESAVKVTANATAALMPHRVDVDKLSTNAYLISNKKISEINSNSNAQEKAKNYLKDIFFSDLSSSKAVKSVYNSATLSNSDKTITYSSTEGVNTKTALTRDGSGAITKIEYKGTASNATLEPKYDFSEILATDKITSKTIAATYASSNVNTSGPTSSSSESTKTTYLYDDGEGNLVEKDNFDDYEGLTYSGSKTTTTTTNTNTTTETITLNGGQTITLTTDEISQTISDMEGATSTTNSTNVSVDFSGSSTNYSNGTISDPDENGTRTITFAGTSAPTIKLTTTASGGYTAEIIYSATSNADANLLNPDTNGASSVTTTTEYNQATKTETATYDATTNSLTNKETSIIKYTDSNKNKEQTNLVTTTTVETDASNNKTITDKTAVYGYYNNGNGDRVRNGYTSMEITETTKKDSSGTIITREATTDRAYESGVSGKTKTGQSLNDANGDAFANGKGESTVKTSDVAISFKIGDGTGNETGVIEYTYAQLLNDELSIYDLVSKINTETSNNNVNIRASYDEQSGRFFLYNSKSGAEDKIVLTATGDDSNGNYTKTATVDFFNALNLAQSSGGDLVNSGLTFNKTDSNGKTYAEVAGSYGSVRIDGVRYDNIKDNKLTVFGVTYNFTNTTTTNPYDSSGNLNDASIRGDNPVTVSATQDVEAIVDKVKSFVESYNKILSSLYEKYDEKPDSGYKPLTQAQKDAMKEDQIEKWENKAKQGLLYHDQTLGKIIGQMRESITATVEGIDTKFTDANGNEVTYNSIFSIGISTTGIKGQLVLDETKLRSALSVDADSVYNVFARLTKDTEKNAKGEAKSKDKNGIVKTDGIAQRLGDILTNANKLIKKKAGSTADVTEDSDLNNLLRELQTKMSNFKKMMNAFEERLYKKYDAMESALVKLGTQLSFITGGQ